MNKKQAVYWLSIAMKMHSEPEVVAAFKIAMKELTKQSYRDELTQISTIYT